MTLNSISILNYKNIAEAALEFCNGINCFVGNNGVGKTNLLDSVYYLACTKSRSGLTDSQNLRHGEPFFMLQGDFVSDNSDYEVISVQVAYKNGGRKSFKNCGKEYQRLADHIGLIPIVIVSPQDSSLISEWSDNRRRFLDSVISQYSRDYLYNLLNYNKWHAQRDLLLKQQAEDPTLYDVCEAQMAESAQAVYVARSHFVEEFVKVFDKYYKLISAGKEQVRLIYRSQLDAGNYQEQLFLARKVDVITGHTTKGVHKDDLDMLLGDYPIKKVGSQGQNKTFLLALKFAQFEYLKRIMRRTPILLLDDIFDKLDVVRVEQIIRIVSSGEFGQIFITDTNRTNLDALLERSSGGEFKIFEVSDGKVVQ